MIWVWREGGQIPHGPFKLEEEARLYAEALARSYPGEAIWLHPATANVMMAAAEPIWDEGVPLSKVRPLALGYAELLAETHLPVYAPPKHRKPEVGVKLVSSSAALGFFARLFRKKERS
ncbi:hypothetical protein EHF33_20565 (plasmid) [Deinococcus psychrotolerans]|uniref:Uncharacterized protein n=1 Tax=Deinococcus psychrotolerans TaxID=2489213 RepID=A0A3G8YK82_9DEIO|nr:hypothetical protein [Deinococcus psychrotolerans]AZI45305.1 hypothetical protein EHF33_20565 [Deinococcus psychrotolerans]